MVRQYKLLLLPAVRWRRPLAPPSHGLTSDHPTEPQNLGAALLPAPDRAQQHNGHPFQPCCSKPQHRTFINWIRALHFWGVERARPSRLGQWDPTGLARGCGMLRRWDSRVVMARGPVYTAFSWTPAHPSNSRFTIDCVAQPVSTRSPHAGRGDPGAQGWLLPPS